MLREISNSRGDLLFVYNGHSAKSKLQPHNTENIHDTSVAQLGEALIKRRELHNVRIVFNSCYSYNFATGLCKYLIENGLKKGRIKGLPIIITETNKDSASYGMTFNSHPVINPSMFYSALSNVLRSRLALTISDIISAQESLFTILYLIAVQTVFWSMWR